MKEKRYYWLKLYDTFFENKTSKFLRKLPDGDKILIVYLKMQLKLLKTEGVFCYEDLCQRGRGILAQIKKYETIY